MGSDKFQGFQSPQENWSKLPHQLIDALPQIETLGEMKIILYTLRHTWGFKDDYKKITLSEFQHGRKRRDGSRLDSGTGLTKPTIIDGIKRAISHGFLFEHVDTSDPARVKKFYSLVEEGLNFFTSGVKKFNPRGKESLHRTEKETKEKETVDNSPTPKPPFGYGLNAGKDGFDRADQAERNDLNTLADQIAEVCSNINLLTAHPDTKKEIKRITLSFWKMNITPDDLKDFSLWWYDNTWQGKKEQAPTLKQLGDKWGQFEAQKVINVPITVKNGFYI
jgi:hypothetical protein